MTEELLLQQLEKSVSGRISEQVYYLQKRKMHKNIEKDSSGALNYQLVTQYYNDQRN